MNKTPGSNTGTHIGRLLLLDGLGCLATGLWMIDRIVSAILIRVQTWEETHDGPNMVVLYHYACEPYTTINWLAGSGQLGTGFYVFVEQRPPSTGLWWAEYRILRSTWDRVEKVSISSKISWRYWQTLGVYGATKSGVSEGWLPRPWRWITESPVIVAPHFATPGTQCRLRGPESLEAWWAQTTVTWIAPKPATSDSPSAPS